MTYLFCNLENARLMRHKELTYFGKKRSLIPLFAYMFAFVGNTVSSINYNIDNLVRTCHSHQENTVPSKE